MESERRVNPACPNAGNPFHQCAAHCGGGGGGRRIAASGAKSPVVNGERVRVEGRIVDPNCVNAANPFHQCAEHCKKKAAEARKQAGSGRFAFPVLSKLSPRSLSDRSDGSKSANGAGVGVEGRNVDPNCVNASNRFHQCSDYCANRTADGRQQIRTSAKARNGELINEAVRKMQDGRKVDPTCVNASNPFHQCTEHCSLRTLGAKRLTTERPLDRSKRSVNVVTEKRDVDPRCVNASNPFHKCAEYCFERIQEAS